MALSIKQSEIFIQSTLRSALDLLSTHIQKQPSSSSHIHNQLTRLHQSLLQMVEKKLQFHTQQDSTHLLTQLKSIAYAANDLVDDIEYKSMQQEIEEFNRSNPDEPVIGPSIPQFKGFQTGESDVIGVDSVNVLPADQGEEGNKNNQISTKRKDSGATFLSKFKSLFSAITKFCKCLDSKGAIEKTSNAHDSSPTKLDVVDEVLDISSEDTNIGDRISKIVEKLDYFASHFEYGTERDDNDRDFVRGGLDGVVNRPVIDGEVYGREGERERLVKVLLELGEECVSVVPIIGNGGVGKTTLAHYVYNNERIEKHFHMREWICASDTFDMMRIVGELNPPFYLSGPFNQLQLLDNYERHVMPQLKGKRFLLVLDDVRSVEWTLRFASIDTDVKGSKILLTAREEQVVDEESKKSKIVLEGLRGEEFWAFFKRCSFGDKDPNKYPELHGIGKGIAEKFEGSPLATKLVGGALREKLNNDHWMSILRSELWVTGRAHGNVMPALSLSYKHLPLHLQRCFAYCSVFPRGYAFDIEKLVHIWMAQGLIRLVNKADDVGGEYFRHLLTRSFFELPSYSKSYWRSKYYLMHELLHDLAEAICLDDSLVYGGQKLEETSKGVHHLSITLWTGLKSEFEWKNLQTLIINTKHVMELEVLKSVRVLDLSHSYMRELPDSIGCLIHLRYLNLSGNYIHILPESLCKLHHLQSLIAPDRCRRLPKGTSKLVSLRHLSASDEAISWIAGIGRLMCLQELKVFHVRKVKGHELGQLKGLGELRDQLCIQCLDDVKNKEEVLEANLKDKIHINKLQLKWMRWNRNRKVDIQEDVLDCLEPPPSLKELEIHWYSGLRSPSWLKEQSLQNLKYIHLIGCKKWNHLPPFGQLPFLEVLKIEAMDAIVQGDNEYPSLKELWLMDTSVTFEGSPIVSKQRHKLFPCLCKLSVQNCSSLNGLPPLSVLQTLEELNVRKCSDLDAEMPGCLSSLTSLSTLKMSELQLTYFPGEILQWLKHMEIESCRNLTTWTAEEKEGGSLSSLTSLCITDTLLPTGPILKKYLTSLQELRLNRCSKLKSFTVEQQKWFGELTLLRELSITDCENLKSLPVYLHHLPNLLTLTVSGCPSIQSLPTELPISLRRLELSNCNPGLAIQWEDEKSPDWVKRVPYRYIY